MPGKPVDEHHRHRRRGRPSKLEYRQADVAAVDSQPSHRHIVNHSNMVPREVAVLIAERSFLSKADLRQVEHNGVQG